MSFIVRTLVLVVLASINVSVAVAQSAPSELALALSATDKQVTWGPCPAFMPEGCRLAVLHGDPAKPNADVLLKVPSNQGLPHHWHTSAERMVLISGELEVAYDGQQATTLKAGMYAYGPAKLPHSAKCGNAGECVLFIAFEGPVDAIPTDSGKE